MHHFLGKCNTFTAFFARPAAPPKDRLSAIKMMNWRPPQRLYNISEVRTLQTPLLCPF